MRLSGKVESVLRRLRPLVAFLNLLRWRRLAGVAKSYRWLGIRRPRFAPVRHAQVRGRGEGAATGDRGVAAIEADRRFEALPAQVREQLRAWPERGYLVLERFVSPQLVDAANADIERLISENRLREHTRSPRVMDAWRKSRPVAEIVSDLALVEVLELLLGRPVRLEQTISFHRGSRQSAHSDAFHMMTEPPGFLLGVWIALEDVDADAGPVFYYPGSHRLPYVMSDDLDLPRRRPLITPEKGRAYVEAMRERTAAIDAEPVPFTCSAGDVLVWHHNLLHGGAPIDRPDSTRRSLVAHYFAADVLCYHEVTERPAPAAPDAIPERIRARLAESADRAGPPLSRAAG